MSTSRFRCYRTHDVIGVELGGALKNVLAIACGISGGCTWVAWKRTGGDVLELFIGRSSPSCSGGITAACMLGSSLHLPLHLTRPSASPPPALPPPASSDGLGFGSNGRAAIITRGLDEITRLAGEGSQGGMRAGEGSNRAARACAADACVRHLKCPPALKCRPRHFSLRVPPCVPLQWRLVPAP